LSDSRKGISVDLSAVLSRGGLGVFPDNEQLNICLGLSYMNLGKYEKALESFLKFRNSEHAAPHIAECYRVLEERESGSEFVK